MEITETGSALGEVITAGYAGPGYAPIAVVERSSLLSIRVEPGHSALITIASVEEGTALCRLISGLPGQ